MAIITRWRSPPESWCGYCPSRCAGDGDADACQQLDGARRAPAPRAPPRWRRSTSISCVADRVGRVQRGHRLLEDHRHAVAAQRVDALARWRGQILAGEAQLSSPSRCAARRQQVHHRQRRDRLAAAGFADEAHASRPRDTRTTRRAPHAARRRRARCRRARSCDLEDGGARHRQLLSGAEQVAQAVADQVDGRAPAANSATPGNGDQPGREEHVVLGLGDHQAPGRQRRLHAEAEEGQRRLEQDRAAPSPAWRPRSGAAARWAAPRRAAMRARRGAGAPARRRRSRGCAPAGWRCASPRRSGPTSAGPSTRITTQQRAADQRRRRPAPPAPPASTAAW